MLSFKHAIESWNHSQVSLTPQLNLGDREAEILVILRVNCDTQTKQQTHKIQFRINTNSREKVFMYLFEEDVTFLIDETQVERVMSQNSDSDFMIQTIDDETDVTEWQVIDHKQLLSKNQKKMLDDLKQVRDHFNSRSKHSHQIQIATEFISQ